MTEKKLRKELTRIVKENIVTFETFEQRTSDYTNEKQVLDKRLH